MLLTEWSMDTALKVRGEECMEKKAKEIAKNLQAKGMSVNDIAETTGLTVDDILRL
jgi:predicted transposase YdaD